MGAILVRLLNQLYVACRFATAFAFTHVIECVFSLSLHSYIGQVEPQWLSVWWCMPAMQFFALVDIPVKTALFLCHPSSILLWLVHGGHRGRPDR